MADDSAAPVATEPTTTEIPTRPADAAAEPAVAEAKPSEGDAVIATEGVAEVPEEEKVEETTTAKEETTADTKPDAAAASNETDAAPAAESAAEPAAEPAADASATNGTATTPAKKTNNGKRKSVGGIPEHKTKKTPAKGKKKAPELRLDAQPGDMYMVAMRGYQPWPVIVCDEEMLPESLLSKRPVSAKRIDGTYREDFLEGGKNAKDRRYPIMFLGTNEFAWQVNTELLTFDIEDVKKDVESGNSAKKNKALWSAYEIAAEGHDLAYFKNMLASHEAALQEDAEAKEAKEAEKQEKKEKAAKRKSIAAADSDDVEMADAGDDAAPSAKKAKASKKRKADGSEGDEPAAKTPKTTKLKLNNKTPKDGSAAKPKKETKSKKKSEEAPAQPEEPPMTEEERLIKREKQILYLRHRLQKGFLSRDQAPKDEDMTNMADYLKQLEQHEDLEADIIKKTKVHKVLKAIIKLDNIPKEEVHNFKSRSTELLNKWNGALASADGESAEKTTPAATNGVKADDEKSESAKADTPAVEKKEETEESKEESKEEAKEETKVEPTEETKDEAPKEDAPAEPTAAAPADKDGDVSMADVEATKEAPAIVDAPNPEGVNAATTESKSETAAPTIS
ncbi:hypothetical protein N0V87_000441 [Didymella glomerata]|uniref:PWWP domain-containing protein n=1 Tax=Didymella glomerata TaxID=749621 RepID=A0A9W9C4K2_9PLEO|nr:hypothetical protein N0V87_000441 [Didymella glomerata]